MMARIYVSASAALCVFLVECLLLGGVHLLVRAWL